jgi:hypothetical protein
MTVVDFADDSPGGFCPDERRRGLIVVVDVRCDGALQSGDATERATSNPTTRDFGKKAFHRVEPRRACRCEMDAVARMGCEPLFDVSVLMRRVVVHDQMNIELSRNGAIDMLQEFDELFMSVTGQAALDDFPRERVEGGEQRRGPVSSVVVRLPRRDAFPQRQDRRGSLQSLNAALFVDTQDDSISRRILRFSKNRIVKRRHPAWRIPTLD